MDLFWSRWRLKPICFFFHYCDSYLLVHRVLLVISSYQTSLRTPDEPCVILKQSCHCGSITSRLCIFIHEANRFRCRNTFALYRLPANLLSVEITNSTQDNTISIFFLIHGFLAHTPQNLERPFKSPSPVLRHHTLQPSHLILGGPSQPPWLIHEPT